MGNTVKPQFGKNPTDLKELLAFLSASFLNDRLFFIISFQHLSKYVCEYFILDFFFVLSREAMAIV